MILRSALLGTIAMTVLLHPAPRLKAGNDAIYPVAPIKVADTVPPLPERRPRPPDQENELKSSWRNADTIHVANSRRPACTHLGCSGSTVVGIGF